MDYNDKDKQGGLKIQVKKKLFEFKLGDLLRFIFVIIISVVCGALTAAYITSVYVSEIKDTVIISEEDDQITNSIKKTIQSIVTISNNKNAINNNSNADNISGIIINENGYIITNYNKIKDYEKLYVKIADVAMNPIEGCLINKNEELDIALIKIDMEGLTAIKFGNYEDINIGQTVYAIGNVYNSSDPGMSTVGRVTSKCENIKDDSKIKLLQTDAIVNSDNSGGALCDINGNLLGILNDTISKDKKSLYYAVNIDAIKNFWNETIKKLNVIGIEEKTVVIGNSNWSKGVYINSVESGSMAEKSGLKPTDIIVEIDGQKINYIEDIFFVIENKKNGENIECIILREGKEKKIDLKIFKDNN